MSPEQPTVSYRPVQGFPGYRVGDDGSVWSCYIRGSHLHRLGPIWRQLMPGRVSRFGHLVVHFCPTSKTHYVHRLVLEAFVGPCPPGMECRHLDGDTSNNRLANLCWGSPRENAADRHRHGHTARGEDHGQSVLTADQVRTIRAAYAAGGTTHRRLAREYGVSDATVGAILTRHNWTHLD